MTQSQWGSTWLLLEDDLGWNTFKTICQRCCLLIFTHRLAMSCGCRRDDHPHPRLYLYFSATSRHKRKREASHDWGTYTNQSPYTCAFFYSRIFPPFCSTLRFSKCTCIMLWRFRPGTAALASWMATPCDESGPKTSVLTFSTQDLFPNSRSGTLLSRHPMWFPQDH